MLLGDFNLNLLDRDTDKKVTQFVDELRYTNSFILYINLPTGITKHSEKLIDNILYNKFIPDSVAGNVNTGISDHLIQFLIEPLAFLKHNKKNNTTYHCFKHFNKESFKNEITNIIGRKY